MKSKPTKEEVAAKKRLSALVVANNNEQAKAAQLAEVIKERQLEIETIKTDRVSAMKSKESAILGRQKEEGRLEEAQFSTQKANGELLAASDSVKDTEKQLASIERKVAQKKKELEDLVATISGVKQGALKDITIILEKAKTLF